jgi:hypothetical protein
MPNSAHDTAVSLVQHYFRMIAVEAGAKWNDDNYAEKRLLGEKG